MTRNDDESLNVMVEILSCRDLPIGDITSSDPYVKVKLGKKDIHHTKHITRTLNPKYTEKENNVFLLQCTKKDLKESYGLLFKVKDWDLVSANDELGSVLVPPEQIIKATGKKTEYRMTPKSRKKDHSAGFIKLCFRPATEQDIQTMGKNQRGWFGKSSPAPAPAPAPVPAPAPAPVPPSEAAKKPKKSAQNGAGRSLDDDISTRSEDMSIVSSATIATTQTNQTASTAKTAKSSTTKSSVGAHSLQNKSGEKLNVLIQIKCCRDLVIGDNCDPYVRVKMGKKRIHQTKPVSNTDNPQFREPQNNIFILDYPPQTLATSKGLTFVVADHSLKDDDDEIGKVRIPPKAFLNPSGDLREYKLKREDSSEKVGYIRLRIRNATREDHHRINKLSKSKMVSAPIPDEPDDAVKKEKTGAGSPSKGNKSKQPKNTQKNTQKKSPKTPTQSETQKIVEKIKIDTVSPTRGVITDPDEMEVYDAYTRVQLRGKDVRQITSLLKIARKREPNFTALEIYGLKAGDTEFDDKFVEELLEHSILEKIVFIDFELMISHEIVPPILDSLTELPELGEIEIRMEQPGQLPTAFLSNICEFSESVHTLILSRVILLDSHIQILCEHNYSQLTNLILWNLDLDFSELKLMCKYLEGNMIMNRFELWCSDLSDNFGLVLAEMLKENKALERMVISHVGLYGASCIALMDALTTNRTLKELALLSVSNGDKDKVSRSAMQMMMNQTGIKSLAVTYEEMNEDDCYQMWDDLKRTAALREEAELIELAESEENNQVCIIL